jgi:pimeloyl-ACP methyl ester carboxylesterase
VLAIHGTPGSRLMFALSDQAARERGLRIVAPDRAGYGLTTFRHCATFEETTEDVRALADALGWERFAAIGVSGGGPHVIAFAASMPGRVALLALVSPMGPIAELCSHIRLSRLHRLLFTRIGRSPQSRAAFFWSVRSLVTWAPDVAYRILAKRITASDRSVLARSEVRANLQAALREALRPGIDGALQDLRLFCAPWGVTLESIDAPAMVWQGSDDTIVPPDAAYHLARALPNCRLHVAAAAGHYWGFGQFGPILDIVASGLRAP